MFIISLLHIGCDFTMVAKRGDFLFWRNWQSLRILEISFIISRGIKESTNMKDKKTSITEGSHPDMDDSELLDQVCHNASQCLMEILHLMCHIGGLSAYSLNCFFTCSVKKQLTVMERVLVVSKNVSDEQIRINYRDILRFSNVPQL